MWIFVSGSIVQCGKTNFVGPCETRISKSVFPANATSLPSLSLWVLVRRGLLSQLRSESMCNKTWHGQISPRRPRQMTFMTTKVHKFAGVTSWEQYRQVFDAIVLSNGWDDTTAALHLLSHLEGDALNVALLVPEVRRSSCVGLVGALTVNTL